MSSYAIERMLRTSTARLLKQHIDKQSSIRKALIILVVRKERKARADEKHRIAVQRAPEGVFKFDGPSPLEANTTLASG